MEAEKQSNQVVNPRFRNLRGPIFTFMERDLKILDFLWRWKLGTTATLHEAVGKPGSPYATYKAMERLAKHGHVESVKNLERGFSYWQLTKKGFESIRESLGELKKDARHQTGHPWHDLNVVAFQLGEWTALPFPQVKFFTEQELRSKDRIFIPNGCQRCTSGGRTGIRRLRRIKNLGSLRTKSSFRVSPKPNTKRSFDTTE